MNEPTNGARSRRAASTEPDASSEATSPEPETQEEAAPVAGYRVADGTQVLHAGVVHNGGEPLPAEVPIEQTRFWLGAGWIEAAQPA